MASAGFKDLSLEQMEADIKLCEELLAMDSFPGDKAGTKKPFSAVTSVDANSAQDGGRLTDARRGEIMLRLNKHKSSPPEEQSKPRPAFETQPATETKPPGVMTAAERRDRVQHLLRERTQRLSNTGVQSGASAAAHSPSYSSGNANANGFTPDSARRGNGNTGSFITPAKAASVAGHPVARPASAPRERPRHPPGVSAPFNLSAMKGGRHSREAIAAKAKQAEQAELTFKPATNTRPRSAKTVLMDTVTSEERISRLSTPRTKLWQQCEQIRSDRTRDETKECTFAPRVGRGPRMAGASNSTSYPDRLYADGETRYRKREESRRQLVEAEINSFPFQPAINDNSRAAVEAGGYRPIHERVGELLRKRNEALAAARVQVELENPDLTFAPKVNESSRAIARGLEMEGGFEGRWPVERDSRASASRPSSARASASVNGVGAGRPSSARRRSYDARARDEHTFAPKLNDNTRRLCEMMAEEGVRGGNGSFLERQAEHLAKSRKEKDSFRDALESADCTFHPNTGNTHEVLLRSKHVVRLGETPRERIARLAFLEKQQRDVTIQQAQDAYHAQFSFRPTLSNSARGKSATPLHELVSNPRGAEIRAAAEAAAQEAFAMAHSFEPNVGAKHADAVPRPFQVNYSLKDGITTRIREYRREKEVVLQEARNEAEFRELEACTFQPNFGKVRRSQTKQPSGVGVHDVVPGLGRHLELRKRAKAMADETNARAAKVFLEDVGSLSRTHRQTVPLSPKISVNPKAQQRKLRAVMEKEQREREACTFRPMTNERPRKALIAKILAEDDGY